MGSLGLGSGFFTVAAVGFIDLIILKNKNGNTKSYLIIFQFRWSTVQAIDCCIFYLLFIFFIISLIVVVIFGRHEVRQRFP